VSRRQGQRFDAEHGVTTEALIFLGDLDPEAVGPSIEYATHYEPTPVDEFARLLAHSTLAPEGATFLDIGSGMGRVALLAMRAPFKQIVGVEISPALHEVALENLATYRTTTRACGDVRFVRADAATFAPPKGDLVVYLYNPFQAPILAAVLERLLAEPREIVLLYHTPLERATIEATGAFDLVADLFFGVVFARKAGVRATP